MYLSPDPIGLSGGVRTHAYVPQQTGETDPLGLAKCPIRGVNEGFAKWFNKLTPDEFNSYWEDYSSTIKDRLRSPAVCTNG